METFFVYTMQTSRRNLIVGWCSRTCPGISFHMSGARHKRVSQQTKDRLVQGLVRFFWFVIELFNQRAADGVFELQKKSKPVPVKTTGNIRGRKKHLIVAFRELDEKGGTLRTQPQHAAAEATPEQHSLECAVPPALHHITTRGVGEVVL